MAEPVALWPRAKCPRGYAQPLSHQPGLFRSAWHLPPLGPSTKKYESADMQETEPGGPWPTAVTPPQPWQLALPGLRAPEHLCSAPA